jgi:urate oxidase
VQSIAQADSNIDACLLPNCAQTTSQSAMAQLATHQHGKGQVRLGRLWRDGANSTFVEWTVDTVLDSAMEHAYLEGTNTGMTATDTQKNTIYYMAKKMKPNAAPEDFALALARHFVETYEPVSKARVNVAQAPWNRHVVDGTPHEHGYAYSGTGVRTAFASYTQGGDVVVHGGVKDWKLLKTTQSGYEGAPPSSQPR